MEKMGKVLTYGAGPFYKRTGPQNEKIIRAAVISDTHGLLRESVLAILKGCDVIIHGGDINTRAIVNQLETIAPLYIVRGNNDKEWAMDLPVERRFSIGNLSCYMIHNKKEASKTLDGVDLVIFGHSHKYFCEEVDGKVWLNPGSCGKRRFDQEITLALLTIGEEGWNIDKIVLPQE